RMSNIPEDELLSAYLDGELNGAELAQVEQLLSRSASARELLEELRALSAEVKSLPVEKLDEDLSKSVLRIVEQKRKKATSESAPSADFAETPERESTVVYWSRTILHRLNNPRIWAWEAVIVAVALLLLFFNPQQEMAPRQGEAARREIALKEQNEKLPSAVAPRSSITVGAPATAATELSAETSKVAAANKPASMESLSRRRSSLSEKPAMARRVKLADTSTELKSKSQISAALPAEKSQQSFAQAPASAQILVVHCDISEEARKNQAFDKLLAENKLVRQKMPADKFDAKTMQKAEASPTVLRNNVSSSAADERSFGRISADAAEGSTVEYVYVEAPFARIEAAIAGLSSQSQNFQNVLINQTNDVSILVKGGRKFQTLHPAAAPAHYGASRASKGGGQDATLAKPARQNMTFRQYDANLSFYKNSPKMQQAVFVLRVVNDVQNSPQKSKTPAKAGNAGKTQ
ncbi:MAG: anti-sigma factor family protein, partial [Thermoguttaceae bacterium]